MTAVEPSAGAFALVVIAYLHLPPEERRRVLGHAASALAPGGTLFLIGHAVRNLKEGYGGPQRAEVLWDPEVIRSELRPALGLAVDRARARLAAPVENSGGNARGNRHTSARAPRAHAPRRPGSERPRPLWRRPPACTAAHRGR